MIIKREFVPFIQLYNNDPEIKLLIDEMFADTTIDSHFKEHCIKFLMWETFHEREMGWCVPFNYMSRFIELLEKLDKNKPYDNGLTIKDAGDIEIIEQNNGDTIVGLITKETLDCVAQYIGFIKFDEKNVVVNVDVPQHRR